MLSDWLYADAVMFWMFRKEIDCDQVTSFEPLEVLMVDEIERVLCAKSLKYRDELAGVLELLVIIFG